ncbi:hypothetical protein [Algoriphagus pacificus]|uniref:Uncharacterized protein n=1 Tax=Algoriphagus pacificus TaxID=2811234 RepID=A0ABS3CL07_9BACT|nr:hypothetical protein [Algoriphagus pacificus]MBN7817791.1 hypothetical protein [Algoriphagus pacificus]
MQKKALHLLLFTALFILIAQLQAQAVYITKTGAKYHKETCRYAKTGRAATLTEAKKKGLTACLVCNPSATDNKSATPTPAKSKTSETNKAQNSSSQCIATTKAGSRCYRKAASGSKYCWQHVG